MIKSFKHNGLELFFNTGRTSGIQVKHSKKLKLILGRLNAATAPEDMKLQGLFLHPLSGNRSDIWSVRVSGNWRVTFRFNGNEAEIVNYEDYH
ncbi:MAG: type II toxin-antitoxin system RelE/ParE family toxin [gamma proteobacterium symbiont of Taylorina sp.]|nr:type II toxin-antitoxin system RelE/ParE family toxin [gamma proteobacterium symbiont of Taylorina sp.]